MFRRPPRILLVALLGLSLAGSAVSGKRFNIMVNAEAEAEYMQRAQEGEYQTYHVIKGKYHGGSTRDRGLEKTRFEDLFESLAETLKKRNMFPESNRFGGDLLIMVSWGRTSLDADWGDLQGITGSGELGGADRIAPFDADQDDAMASAAPPGAGYDSGRGRLFPSGGSSQRAKNMALLGLQGKLRGDNPFGNSADEHLWEALGEERYFVILNAFDYQYLLESKELKQVWRVRYSTRAAGVAFQTAFESMNDAISGVVGLQLDEIATVKGDTSGSISMGDLEMVEMSDAEKREVGE